MPNPSEPSKTVTTTLSLIGDEVITPGELSRRRNQTRSTIHRHLIYLLDNNLIQRVRGGYLRAKNGGAE